MDLNVRLGGADDFACRLDDELSSRGLDQVSQGLAHFNLGRLAWRLSVARLVLGFCFNGRSERANLGLD